MFPYLLALLFIYFIFLIGELGNYLHITKINVKINLYALRRKHKSMYFVKWEYILNMCRSVLDFLSFVLVSFLP